MKYIEKKIDNEPEPIRAYKNSTHGVSFKSLHSTAKRTLKKALLEEQGNICAYCMQRILPASASIEHFLPQSEYPDLSLNYENLLAVCDGNQGHGKHLLQCDKKKGNKLLNKVDPRKKEIEQYLHYRIDGMIYAKDSDIQSDLMHKLNLNNQRIVENRKVVIDAVIQFIQKTEIEGVKKEYNKWKERDESDFFKEYCQVGVFFFKKALQ